MEQKPFSVGVRIEHPQQLINRAQYGKAADHPALGAADYKLSMHLRPKAKKAQQAADQQGRGVYTFCMCPGGEVVCAASEPGGVVVNGMSRFARDGRNANSALLVGVGPEDFESADPLAGVQLPSPQVGSPIRLRRKPWAISLRTLRETPAKTCAPPTPAA